MGQFVIFGKGGWKCTELMTNGECQFYSINSFFPKRKKILQTTFNINTNHNTNKKLKI